MCHGALAEHGAEEEAARAAPSGPALPRGLPARGEAVLPACEAHPSSSAGGGGSSAPVSSVGCERPAGRCRAR